MSSERRLRLLYLVPGHGLLSTFGPTRNVLSLAHALQNYADVTVAFRYVVDTSLPNGTEVVEIQPGSRPKEVVDDSAMRGLGARDLIRYLADLRRFTLNAARRYDVILEKSWLFSGYLSSVAAKHGVAGIPVENVVPSARRHVEAGLVKRLKVTAGAHLAGRFLRKAPLIIAETEQLKADMVRVWGIEPARIDVVGLGVDSELFRPADQALSRQALGIREDVTVLTYVGALDETHTLDAAIQALASRPSPAVELHLVGDGPKRQIYERKAAAHPGTVVFHGRVPHERVPLFISAADLCLAPYDPRAFATGSLGYSTMKVPEYLSMGRPVASLPSERMRELLKDGESGFLFDNTLPAWQNFLLELPSRERLAEMGRKAAQTPLPSWDKTARGYLAACERLVRNRQKGKA